MIAVQYVRVALVQTSVGCDVVEREQLQRQARRHEQRRNGIEEAVAGAAHHASTIVVRGRGLVVHRAVPAVVCMRGRVVPLMVAPGRRSRLAVGRAAVARHKCRHRSELADEPHRRPRSYTPPETGHGRILSQGVGAA